MEAKKATEEVSNSGQIFSSVVMDQYKVPIVPQTIISSALLKDTLKDEGKQNKINCLFGALKIKVEGHLQFIFI